MSGAEDSHFSMPFSMDDVTSKIAYAYAKQQVFVLLGLFSVVAGALLVVLEWPTHAGDSYLGLIDDVVLFLGGLGILSTVAVEKDLKRVNRHAMAVLAVVGLVQVVVLALSFSGILKIEDAGDLSDDLGVAAVIILGLVAYPFPTRRGGGLYSPEKVRILSNARTLAFAAFAGAVAALGALPSSSEHAAASGMFMSPFSDEIGLLAVGALGVALFLALENGPKLVRWLSVVVGVELIVAIGGAADEVRSVEALGDDVPKVLVALFALVIVFLLSQRLNKGKTIIDRRA